LIGSSTAAAALTKAAMMINILSKNDSSKNNQAYSLLDAIKGMGTRSHPLRNRFLPLSRRKHQVSFAAMTNLLHLPNTQRVNKWGHAEALVKIWELFREIPTLVDGSFVGRYTRLSNELNNDLDTFIGIMTSI
jgi:hypothetical protein